MSDKFKFTTSGSNVTAVFQYDDGKLEPETIESNQTWSYDASSNIVTLTEVHSGATVVETYTDLDNDGYFIKSSHSSTGGGSGGSTSNSQEGYMLTFDGTGHLLTAAQYEHGTWETEELDEGDTWTLLDDGTVKRQEDGDDEYKIYSLGSDGVYYLTKEVNAEGEVTSEFDEDDRDGDGSDDDFMFGSSNDDRLSGGNGDDDIETGAGDDSVDGGSGADVLDGGAGNDDIYGGLNDDLMYGGAGNDTIDGGVGDDTVSYARMTANLVANLKSGSVTGEGTDHLSSVENLMSGSGDDDVTGSDDDNEIDSGSGDDDVNGGSGDDVISGDDGNDSLEGGLGDDDLHGGSGTDHVGGGSGNDDIDGGSGNDDLSGADGNDDLIGGLGADKLSGGNGTDKLDGGSGNDSISGGTGNDRLLGGDGDDKENGGSGNDNMAGGAGTDTVHGDTGNDTVSGGDGSDHIYGDDGNDRLSGGNGRDYLAGGKGDDVLFGGAGADRFIFKTASETRASSTGDTIRDFHHSEGDKVDLSGIDARSHHSGNDAFHFIAASALTTGNAEGALWYKNGVLYGSTDGDKAAEFEIHVNLTGINTHNETDYLTL